MSSSFFKPFVLVNPNSSNGRTGRIWPEFSSCIQEHLGTYEHAFTEHRGHGSILVREALAKGFDLIVSVGGDGTHNEVINGFFDGCELVNPDAAIAVATSGTGGDFRKTLGLAAGPHAALETLSGDTTTPIDVGRFTYKNTNGDSAMGYFLNVLSFGIGGLVDQKVNSTTKALGGKTSFFIATLRALSQFRRQTVELSLDGGPATTLQIHNIAVANGRYFGGGMMIAPDADMSDGQFEVVSFVDMSTPSFMSLASSIYKGTHLSHPRVLHSRASRIEALSEDLVLLDVDGEQPGSLPLVIENLPGKIRLKVAPL
jgi:YegS/Rv2252/BmrU family lipid kinase